MIAMLRLLLLPFRPVSCSTFFRGLILTLITLCCLSPVWGKDTDGDGTPDDLEIAHGLNPNDPTEKLNRPNIIFILADDLGYGDIGILWQNAVAGDKKLHTPHFDRMAREGMILNRHYTGAPVCAPARGSLLAGVHQGHAYIRNTDFDDALDHNHSLGSTLQRAGYATALIGKYGLQGEGDSPASWTAYPTKRGFDFFHGYVRHADGHQHYPANAWPLGNNASHQSPKELYENEREISADLDKCFTPDLFTARAKKWIIDHEADHAAQPFFLYLAFDTPHAALQLPTTAYPAGGGTKGGVQWTGRPGHMINTATGTIDSWRHPDYVDRGWTDNEERFATLIRRMDDNIGDLLQTLRDLNIADHTLVVFSADNGPHNTHYLQAGDYQANAFDSFGPFEGIKRDTYEGGVRQPTFAWWPKTISPASIDQTPTQFQDWMATFCNLAGWPTPARSDGVSLVPLLTGQGSQREGIVYIEFNQAGRVPDYPEFTHHAGEKRSNQQVIFVDGFKGVRNNITSHADPFQIYDVRTDLKEAHDLFKRPPAGQSVYFTQLQQRMKDRVLQVRQIERDDPFDPSTDKVESRPYDAELVPPVIIKSAFGMEVTTYEGNWPWLPHFAELTPVKTALVKTFDVTKHLSQPTHAGLCYRGFIKVPADGTWTFFATSDAGMNLRIHDSLVIDDDFNHNGTEASGSIRLAAGLHPFTLSYRTIEKAPALSLQWTGPQTVKQTLLPQVLFHQGTAKR
jgi:arylsulfatase A-like enzyme